MDGVGRRFQEPGRELRVLLSSCVCWGELRKKPGIDEKGWETGIQEACAELKDGERPVAGPDSAQA